MKRVLILSLTFLFVLSALQVQAQKSERKPLKKLEGAKVSELAKNSFKEDFGNLPDVKWKRNGTFDEVLFAKNGKEMTAYYDIDGKLVGTTEVVDFSDIPAAGQKAIKEKYGDYSIGAVIFYDDNEANLTDMVMYGVQFDDADSYFVELTKGARKIVIRVDKSGEITFFREL
jgi:hypothetical protein